MALYQRSNDLAYSNSAVFTTTFEHSTRAPYGGIYRCVNCGHEIAIAKNHTLPPQNSHQHTNPLVPIKWLPIVIHK